MSEDSKFWMVVIGTVLLALLFWGTVIYIASHFIAKWW